MIGSVPNCQIASLPSPSDKSSPHLLNSEDHRSWKLEGAELIY